MTVPGFLDGYLPYLLRKADQTLSARFYAVLAEAGGGEGGGDGGEADGAGGTDDGGGEGGQE